LKPKNKIVRNAATYLQSKYGDDVLELEIKDQYFNMGEVLKEHPEVVELLPARLTARKALNRLKSHPWWHRWQPLEFLWACPPPNVFLWRS